MKQDNAAAGRGSNPKKHGDRWEPAIFWQFIRRDRNLLLHEGQSTVSQSGMVPLPSAAATATAAGEAPRAAVLVLREPSSSGHQAAEPRAWYSYRMHTPPYAGRDSRDIVQEAIQQWWEKQIDEIERDAIVVHHSAAQTRDCHNTAEGFTRAAGPRKN